MVENLLIRPFQPEDQAAAHRLIQEGLAEHFDDFDSALNPDLEDIAANYLKRGCLFLIAELDGELVGTGALIAEREHVGRIVRVSVVKDHRKMGIGRLITENLVSAAHQFRYEQIVVETNDDWFDAIRLYQSCGFEENDRRDGEIHMTRQLQKAI